MKSSQKVIRKIARNAEKTRNRWKKIYHRRGGERVRRLKKWKGKNGKCYDRKEDKEKKKRENV